MDSLVLWMSGHFPQHLHRLTERGGQHPIHMTAYEAQQKLFGIVAKDNKIAISFLNNWVEYCDQIDNLVDTLEDGRPTFKRENIINVFVLAIGVYNHPFYVEHRQTLCMVALLVTNTYTDSVMWERSPIESRRKMADVLRFCGNDMIFAVSTICGGYAHTRSISQNIRDSDWKAHHDELGNPH